MNGNEKKLFITFFLNRFISINAPRVTRWISIRSNIEFIGPKNFTRIKKMYSKNRLLQFYTVVGSSLENSLGHCTGQFRDETIIPVIKQKSPLVNFGVTLIPVITVIHEITTQSCLRSTLSRLNLRIEVLWYSNLICCFYPHQWHRGFSSDRRDFDNETAEVVYLC